MRTSRRRIQVLAVLSVALLAITLLAGSRPADAQGGRAYVLTLDGPLTPAQAAYLQRALNQAQGSDTEVIILQLNTPGGEIGLMQTMVSLIRSSQVPVVVFVAPRRRLAGSAGTVDHPGRPGGGYGARDHHRRRQPGGQPGPKPGYHRKPSSKKPSRPRCAAWRPAPAGGHRAGRNAIEPAKAATARRSLLAAGMVDFLANDVPDLLRQLDGFTVYRQRPAAHTAHRRAASGAVDMNPLEIVLDLLTNPNVVFLLLTLGAQALLIELSNPGGWVAGFDRRCCRWRWRFMAWGCCPSTISA